MNDEELCAIKHLTGVIADVAHELCAIREAAISGIVSRTDLAEAEARITAAIGGAWSIEDQQTLDRLQEAARRKTLRLERLDSKYQRPQPAVGGPAA